MKTPELPGIARAARFLPEDDRVPYAFEKRVMAAVRALQPVDVWTRWSSTMWRAALTCVAISLLTGALAQFNEESSSIELFATDLEQIVLAPITPDETW